MSLEPCGQRNLGCGVQLNEIPRRQPGFAHGDADMNSIIYLIGLVVVVVVILSLLGVV